MTKGGHYEVCDVVAEVKLGAVLVRRYLRLVRPNRPRKSWHRLDRSEFESAVKELDELARTCPAQPLHALVLKQKGAI